LFGKIARMVITVPANERPNSGPRPINLNKDVPQVLELLRLVFGESLDAEGRRILQGQSGINGQPAFLWRFNPMASRLSQGYVWEKDGRIIGNVTLLSTEINGRFLIVNVAVHPDYRRHGIARILMEQVIERVERRHGREILLQVDHDNSSAINLYESLNYANLGAMTTWIASTRNIRSLEAPATPVRPLRGNEWQTAYELDVLALSPDLHWPEPIPRDAYRFTFWRRLSNFINGRHAETRVTDNGRYLTGAASLWSEWGRAHQITLRVHPQWQGQLERPLLAHILNRLPHIPRRNVRINHPASDELTASLLKEANFRPKRTLAHMRLDLT
jgi:ribosomal protein S18 acetylase RimI-like enzyme